MKERLYDVIKWTLIIIVASVAFYIVFPKYHFQALKVLGLDVI